LAAGLFLGLLRQDLLRARMVQTAPDETNTDPIYYQSLPLDYQFLQKNVTLWLNRNGIIAWRAFSPSPESGCYSGPVANWYFIGIMTRAEPGAVHRI